MNLSCAISCHFSCMLYAKGCHENICTKLLEPYRGVEVELFQQLLHKIEHFFRIQVEV